MRGMWIFHAIGQVAFALQVCAQQPGITPYRLDQGPPQSMVRHVLQDTDGFIRLAPAMARPASTGTRG